MNDVSQLSKPLSSATLKTPSYKSMVILMMSPGFNPLEHQPPRYLLTFFKEATTPLRLKFGQQCCNDHFISAGIKPTHTWPSIYLSIRKRSS